MRIGARKSRLARVQAESVADALRRVHPDLEVECAWMETEGDRVQDRPLPEIGGKGLFTARLEAALAAGEIDVAVHSLKDLPTELAPGFEVACVPAREDPRDVLLGPDGPLALDDLAEGATVGTSSPRRRALLLSARPDLATRAIRGNVGTRIRKMREGRVDALLLAAAGLRRLGLLDPKDTQRLKAPDWLPAPGQGALAVEARTADEHVRGLLEPLESAEARAAITAERALLATLEGGCQVPIGALARLENGETLRLDAVVVSVDGGDAIRACAVARAGEARELGVRVGRDLLARGAGRLLSAQA